MKRSAFDDELLKKLRSLYGHAPFLKVSGFKLACAQVVDLLKCSLLVGIRRRHRMHLHHGRW